MDVPPVTRKFVAALSADGRAKRQSPFVLPALDGSPWFVDLRTRKRHDAAYIVYVGRSITAEDVLGRFAEPPKDSRKARKLIESLINAIQRFQIGNVVAVEQSGGEAVVLRLVAAHPVREPGPRLPG